MSLSPLDLSTVRAAAQAALDARLGLIDAIVSAQNERTVAAGKVAEAQAAERTAAATETAAIRAALDGGWSVPELRAAGLKVPQSVAKKSGSSTATAKNSAPRAVRPRPSLPATSPADTSAPHSDAETATDGHQESADSYANAS